MSSIERTLLSKWSTKDVNEVYVQEAVVGVGTYGYEIFVTLHFLEYKSSHFKISGCLIFL